MRSLGIIPILSVLFLSACAEHPAPLTPKVDEDVALAPLFLAGDDEAHSGRFIVVLEDGADPRSLAETFRFQPRHVYRHALKGFTAPLTPGQVDALRRHPAVSYVVQEGRMRAMGVSAQSSPGWSLDRVDERNAPLDGLFTYTSTGQGVRIYVLDSGIRTTHAQFGGRASSGYDAVGGGVAYCGPHGTHVAGAAGGSSTGVARGATLISVRIAQCNTTVDVGDAVAGIDWVTGQVAATPSLRPAVANLSFGGDASALMAPLETAVGNLIAAGVTVVAAAGNDGESACSQTPARIGQVITVGAVGVTGSRSVWTGGQSSNTGSCIDLFAPGDSVRTASTANDTDLQTSDGTSFAAPLVAGAAALHLQHSPTATPAQVHSAVVNAATSGVLSNLGSGSPNRLLFTPALSAPPPSPVLSVTNLNGHPRLTWTAAQGALSYEPILVESRTIDDYDLGFSRTSYTYSLGTTTALALTDAGRPWTGVSYCELWSSSTGSAYDEWEYRVRAHFPGEWSPTVSHPAQLAPVASC